MTSREIQVRRQAPGGPAGHERDEAGRPDQRDGGPGQPERNGPAPGERLLTPEIVTLAVVVVLGSIMTILDATIVNVALPWRSRSPRRRWRRRSCCLGQHGAQPRQRGREGVLGRVPVADDERRAVAGAARVVAGEPFDGEPVRRRAGHQVGLALARRQP